QAPVAKEYDAYPAYSIPGIVLGQIGAIEHLRELGIDVDSAQLAGHSQGSLGVAAVKDARHALAIAVLMGTAVAVTQGAHAFRSHMLAVRGIPREMVEEYLAGDAAIAVVNGRVHFALSGTPEDLAKTVSNLTQAAESYNDALEERRIGGSEINPVFDVL